ncbi:hypothetical protein, partial [Vibrio sp. 10N.261.49.A3]
PNCSVAAMFIYDKQLKQSQLLMIPLLIGSGVVFAQRHQVGGRYLFFWIMTLQFGYFLILELRLFLKKIKHLQ